VEDSHSDVHGPSAPHPWETSAGHLLLPTVPGTAPHGELVPSQLEAPAGERAGSHVTKVYDTTQTPYTRMLARKDVAEQTKEHLLATCAELDMTSLLHEIFLCQEQLDEMARRRQPLVIKKRGSYATISYDGGVLFQVVWVRGMGRSCVH